jgi:curli biogenesis system outer membrane secretion channel CsgG
MRNYNFQIIRVVLAILALQFSYTAHADGSKPFVDRSDSTKNLEAQGVPMKARKHAVTVYEVRSDVEEINARAATDMFTTALIKSRRFRVMERSRLDAGVGKERTLNQDGMTTGDAGAYKLAGAGYIFEPVISEANLGAEESQSDTGIGGMNIGKGNITDVIGMDVRVIDASTGEIVDAINVRKKIETKGSSVSGVGNLIDSALSFSGKSGLGALTPEHSSQKMQRESVDQAIRALIELAVAELSKSSEQW